MSEGGGDEATHSEATHLADGVGAVAVLLEQVGHRDFVERQAHGNVWQPVVDARVQRVAPAHEAGAARTARWLNVVIVQQHSFLG